MSFVDKEGKIIEGGERLVRLLVYTAWELDEGAKMLLFLNDQDVIPAIKEVKRKGIWRRLMRFLMSIRKFLYL